MKSILKLLLILLFVTGCKTKHLQIERKEDRHKEIRKSEKDSVFEQVAESRNQFFLRENEIISQFELETEKDSTGQSKVLEFERIRSPSGEKIIVRGGKVKLKVGSTDRQLYRQKDTLQVNNTSVRTNIQESKITESKSFKKEKEVKTNPFSWLWLTMFASGIIILVLVFLQCKYKLFRWFPVIIMKFKKYLNKV